MELLNRKGIAGLNSLQEVFYLIKDKFLNYNYILILTNQRLWYQRRQASPSSVKKCIGENTCLKSWNK